jgi:hypothetical protein
VDPAQGTIVIRPKFFILAFLLFFFKPRGSINGHEVPLEWRQPRPFPVPPGRYEVGVWCPYLFFPRMGYSAVVVDVMPGSVVEVNWSAPLLVFLTGSISARPVDPQQLYAQGPGAHQPQYQQVQPQHQQPQHQQAQPQYQQAPVQVRQPQAVGGGGGSWQPDPSGRHQYRWWNGTTWAADVSDGGVSSRDPL